jgi:single-strand DNA-binding protein
MSPRETEPEKLREAIRKAEQSSALHPSAGPQERRVSVPVTDFSVAVNKRFTNKDGERVERVTWYKVTCWRKLAETCAQYLKKGRTVIVEGDLTAEAYTDKEGKPQAKLVLTATSVQFVGGGRGEGDGKNVPGEPPAGPIGDEDELPF